MNESYSILLIDNDGERIERISRILGDMGIEVESGDDSALVGPGNREPDAIIVSLVSPGIDGVGICRQLKEKTLIAIGDEADIFEKLKDLSPANIDYVTEPLEAKQLSNRVRIQLERGKTNRSLRGEIEKRQRVEILLRSILEASTDGMIAFDFAGRILNYNHKFCELWGILPEAEGVETKRDILPRMLEQLDDAEGFERQVFSEYLAGHEPGQSTCRLKDGRIYERNSQPQICEGEVIGRVVSYRDITKRTRAEQKLRESEYNYSILAELSPVGIFRDNVNYHRYYVNRRWSEITGMKPEDAYGTGWMNHLAPGDLEKFIREWEAIRHTEPPYQMEIPFVTPENQTKWIYCQVMPEKNASGEIVGYVGALTDITERKEMESRLESALEFNSQIISTVAEGILVLDTDLRYQVWNPYMEELTGIKAEEVLGENAGDRFPFLKDNGIYEAMQKGVRGEDSSLADCECYLAEKDRFYWTSEKYTSLRDRQGNIIGVLGVVNDM